MFNFKDFFNIKKHIKIIFSPTNTKRVLVFATKKIIEYVDRNDLLGVEKKTEVDEAVQDFMLNTCKLSVPLSNKYLRPLCEALLFSVVPMVTQVLYDCLKAFIENLTQKVEEAETENHTEGEGE